MKHTDNLQNFNNSLPVSILNNKQNSYCQRPVLKKSVLKTKPSVIQWLMNNVEYGKDATLGRRFLYENYIECCIKQSIKPVTSGIFGRHVKYLFPERGTKRLGSR